MCVSRCKCCLSLFPEFLTIMLDEISAAVVFLARLIGKSKKVSQEQLEKFKARLSELLVERFENHWFPEQPFRGQGYRCIRINELNRRDATLEKAAVASGIKYKDLKLPIELTIWIDPSEVSYRRSLQAQATSAWQGQVIRSLMATVVPFQNITNLDHGPSRTGQIMVATWVEVTILLFSHFTLWFHRIGSLHPLHHTTSLSC